MGKCGRDRLARGSLRHSHDLQPLLPRLFHARYARGSHSSGPALEYNEIIEEINSANPEPNLFQWGSRHLPMSRRGALKNSMDPTSENTGAESISDRTVLQLSL